MLSPCSTWFGKLCGATCAICGVLIISLPIPIIVNTFNKLYEKAKIKDQISKKKKMAGWTADNKRGSLSKVRHLSQISLQLTTCKMSRRQQQNLFLILPAVDI